MQRYKKLDLCSKSRRLKLNLHIKLDCTSYNKNISCRAEGATLKDVLKWIIEEIGHKNNAHDIHNKTNSRPPEQHSLIQHTFY